MKICGVIWKLCAPIEAPETFVSSHFAIPFTHSPNPQNLVEGRVTAAAVLGWCRSGACTYQCMRGHLPGVYSHATCECEPVNTCKPVALTPPAVLKLNVPRGCSAYYMYLLQSSHARLALARWVWPLNSVSRYRLQSGSWLYVRVGRGNLCMVAAAVA